MTLERFGKKLALIVVSLCFLSAEASGNPGMIRKAQSLFESITGVALSYRDPRAQEMARLLMQGQVYEAASIAANDDAAINVRAREIFSGMASIAVGEDRFHENPLTPLNDFILTGMYFAAGKFEDGDARKMLYADLVAYIKEEAGAGSPSMGSNNHYFEAERPERNINLKQMLDASPQSLLRPSVPSAATAGLLTTRSWGEAHVYAGTNRRPIEYTFRLFLCRTLDSMRDNSAPSDRVGRDVPRDPGGDPAQFVNNCSGCHNGMDALRGAFAEYEMEGSNLVYGPSRRNGNFDQYPWIADKVNRNSDSFPTGYIQRDASWINYFTANQNANIGWGGFTQGNGLKEFGYMIAHSRGFSECMATRIYSLQCMKRHYHVEKMLEDDYLQLQAAQGRIQVLANKFEESGYKLLELMKHTGMMCLND